MDPCNARHPSLHQESGSQVSHSSTFQQIYTNAKGALEKIYFSLNSFFDIAQIRSLEDSYRNLEEHIGYLIPYASFQSRTFDIQ